MKLSEMSQGVPDSARRRVYCLGIISMVVFVTVLVTCGVFQVVAAVQVVVFLVMLSFVVTPEHHDTQVLVMCAGMAAVTAAYLLLTARLLFLLYEKRYGETAGPEWMWWFATMAVVVFNSLMVVWFGLLHDIVPTVVSCLAILTYMLFFKFAKDDIKILRHHNTTQEISVYVLVAGIVLCSCLVLLVAVICCCWCKRRASHPALSSYTSTHTSCRTSAVYSYISSFRHPHEHRRNLTALSRSTNTGGPARAFLPLMSPVPSHPPPPPPLPPQRRNCSSYYHSVKNKPFSPGRAALGTIPSKIKYIRRERRPTPTPPSSREGSDCDHNKITCKSPLLETDNWASQCSSDTASSPQIIYVGPLPSPPIEPPKEAINILSKMPYVSPGPPAVLLETSSFISEASTSRLPCVPCCSDPHVKTQPLHMGQMATLRPPDSECGAGHGFPGTRDWCHLRRRSRSRESEHGDDPLTLTLHHNSSHTTLTCPHSLSAGPSPSPSHFLCASNTEWSN